MAVSKNREFDPNTFVAMIGDSRKILTVPKKQTIFTQGDETEAVFYIQKGKVRLTVVSKTGKEATIAILSEGNFFEEGSLAGQALRMGSAAAMTDCQLLRIEKQAMMDALHREHAFPDMFVAYLLARNIHYEEDLVDQLDPANCFRFALDQGTIAKMSPNLVTIELFSDRLYSMLVDASRSTG